MFSCPKTIPGAAAVLPSYLESRGQQMRTTGQLRVDSTHVKIRTTDCGRRDLDNDIVPKQARAKVSRMMSVRTRQTHGERILGMGTSSTVTSNGFESVRQCKRYGGDTGRALERKTYRQRPSSCAFACGTWCGCWLRRSGKDAGRGRKRPVMSLTLAHRKGGMRGKIINVRRGRRGRAGPHSRLRAPLCLHKLWPDCQKLDRSIDLYRSTVHAIVGIGQTNTMRHDESHRGKTQHQKVSAGNAICDNHARGRLLHVLSYMRNSPMHGSVA